MHQSNNKEDDEAAKKSQQSFSLAPPPSLLHDGLKTSLGLFFQSTETFHEIHVNSKTDRREEKGNKEFPVSDVWKVKNQRKYQTFFSPDN